MKVVDYITTHATGYPYMFIPRPTRSLTLVAAGLAGVSAIGCSKESDQPPRLETAISTGTAGDSVALVSDTSGVAQKPDTSVTTQPVPHKPVGHPVKKREPRVASPVSPKPAGDTTAPAQPRTESTATPAVASAAEASPDKWLSYDAATNTVTFELIAGPFTFNGYRNGEGTLVVPSKANIVMNFINKDGTPHSAIVIPSEGPIPNSASDPAIPRAYTNKVTEGLPQEATDIMRFPVPESGTYRIFCGVPGHGLSGMWIWSKVDGSAKAPSFGPTKG